MLLLRRGSVLVAVHPHFRATAITEIAFLPVASSGTSEGEAAELPPFHALRLVDTLQLDPVVEGSVQVETEARLLEALLAGIETALTETPKDQVLVIENQAGMDWPRTCETRSDVLDPMGNRLHFRWHVEPALRLGRYQLPS